MDLLLIKPNSIRIEACSICQLKCPCCTTGRGITARNVVGSGFLRKEQFACLIDESPWISEVELSNWGEIFLNPEIKDIFRIAFEHNIQVTASNGVNLNTVSEDVLEALVKYKVRHLTCSIDGASQETYVQYRRKGDFGKVVSHIKTINKYKNKYDSKYPKLAWKFVIFGHNEHEISKARRTAEKLNMEFRYAMNWDKKFSPTRNAELILKKEGLMDESRNWSPNPKSMCMQMWKQPQINYDGKVLGCCVNSRHDYGNAFEIGLIKALNNDMIDYARRMLMGVVPSREEIPCTRCSNYEYIKKTGQWISQKEVTRLFLRQIFHPIYSSLGLQRLRNWRS